MEEFYGFLIFTIVTTAALFLPALVELKKPKDDGPRKIVGFETVAFLQAQKEPEPIVQPLSGNVSVSVFDKITNLEV